MGPLILKICVVGKSLYSSTEVSKLLYIFPSYPSPPNALHTFVFQLHTRRARLKQPETQVGRAPMIRHSVIMDD